MPSLIKRSPFGVKTQVNRYFPDFPVRDCLSLTAVTACLRLRVSSCLCQTAKELQVAYTNPLYMAQAYRMKDTLAETAAALEKALGKKAEFGSQDGIKPNKLRKYHYMMMPYFTDPVELAAYKTQEEAMQVVEANLAAGKGACSRSAASMCRGRMSRCSG